MALRIPFLVSNTMPTISNWRENHFWVNFGSFGAPGAQNVGAQQGAAHGFREHSIKLILTNLELLFLVFPSIFGRGIDLEQF